MNDMTDKIEDGKYVELLYKVIDKKTGDVLAGVDFPLSYVHGVNDILAEEVQAEMLGHQAGDVIEVDIPADNIFGKRNESLVFTDLVANVPEEYHEVGSTVIAQNEAGDTLKFIVTRNDGETITFDANNPLCGRDIQFRIEINVVRDATPEEVEAGGSAEPDPKMKDVLDSTSNPALLKPLT